MKQREAEAEHVKGPAYSRRERIAGAFILLAILLLAGGLAFSAQVAFLLADTFTLYARISTAEGVSDEAKIRFNGVDIGQVTSVELTPERNVLLTMKIREAFHDVIRQGSVAHLNRLAVLGDVTIEITRGNPELPVLEDGSFIPVKETPTLDTMLSRLAPAVDDIVATADHARRVVEAVKPEAIAEISAGLRDAIDQLNAITSRISAGEGTIGRLLHDEQLAADIAASAKRLAEALRLAEERLRELEPLISNTTARTEEMKELIDTATGVVNQLGGAIDSLDASGGVLSGVLLEARSALDEAEQTLRAIRHTWPFSGNAAKEDDAPEAVPPQPPTN